jgi:hypothetical protein
LETQNYRESPDGRPYVRHRYVGGGVSGLIPVEEVRLKSEPPRAVRSGEQHSVDISKIHTVHPIGSAMVATLVVQSPLLTNDTAVYCTPTEIIDETTSAITPTEVYDLVKNVRYAIGNDA